MMGKKKGVFIDNSETKIFRLVHYVHKQQLVSNNLLVIGARLKEKIHKSTNFYTYVYIYITKIFQSEKVTSKTFK